MIEAVPSSTARSVAALRAAHQSLDDPRVFDDPLAADLLDEEGTRLLARQICDPTSSARLRATVAVRSRIAEDALSEAIARGVRQYVLLGAGLDTLPYRVAWPDALLRIFEVDHPATQAWKRERLASAGLDLPRGLVFVAMDFERMSLRDALEEAGFRPDRPALFVMLGVVMYVERDALRDTFAAIASLPSGSAELVFDYTEPFEDAAPPIRARYEAMAQRAAQSGEPWRTTFVPRDLQREMRRIGFATIEDLDAEALRSRYFARRKDGFVPGPLAHVIRVRN